jgi:hypothetical protein
LGTGEEQGGRKSGEERRGEERRGEERRGEERRGEERRGEERRGEERRGEEREGKGEPHTSIFKSMPSDLHQQPVLWIHAHRFFRRNIKKIGIEPGSHFLGQIIPVARCFG